MKNSICILCVLYLSLVSLSSGHFSDVLTSQSLSQLGHSPNMPLVVLRYRNLSRMDPDALEGFVELTYLDLSRNNLASL